MHTKNKSKMHWLVVVAMCSLVITGAAFSFMTGGVFLSPMAEDLGVLRGTVALHNTITMLFQAISSLFVPLLIRKYSFKKMITVGALLVATSNYVIGLTDVIWHFNLLSVFRGVGAGLLGSLLL